SNVCCLEMLACHDYRKFLSHQTGLAFSSNAGRVDEAISFAVFLHQLIDSVAGSSGDGGDDSARRSGERVEQSRLADVRMADNGYASLPLEPLLFRPLLRRSFCRLRSRVIGNGFPCRILLVNDVQDRVPQLRGAISVLG